MIPAISPTARPLVRAADPSSLSDMETGKKQGTDHGFETRSAVRSDSRPGGLFFRSPRFAGPCTPTNHRGDLLLEAIVAQGKSPVGRVVQRGNPALRDRVDEQTAAARASLSPASDRAFGRDNRTRGGFQTRPYTKVCLDIRCECDKAGAQRQRGR